MKKPNNEWLNHQNKENSNLFKASWLITDTRNINMYDIVFFQTLFKLNKKVAKIAPRRHSVRGKIYTENQAESMLEAMYIETFNNK